MVVYSGKRQYLKNRTAFNVALNRIVSVYDYTIARVQKRILRFKSCSEFPLFQTRNTCFFIFFFFNKKRTIDLKHFIRFYTLKGVVEVMKNGRHSWRLVNSRIESMQRYVFQKLCRQNRTWVF